MTGMITLIIVLLLITLLGKYCINEGRRVEEHKKFMKNLKEFDKKQWQKEKE